MKSMSTTNQEMVRQREFSSLSLGGMGLKQTFKWFASHCLMVCLRAHTVYFSAANNVDCSAANTVDCSAANNVDCSAANTVDCSAANTVDYSAANTTRIIQGNSLLIHLLSDLLPVVDQINALLNILSTFHIPYGRPPRTSRSEGMDAIKTSNGRKGCYNRRPPTPKYGSTWDPSDVIRFISQMDDNALFPVLTLAGSRIWPPLHSRLSASSETRFTSPNRNQGKNNEVVRFNPIRGHLPRFHRVPSGDATVIDSPYSNQSTAGSGWAIIHLSELHLRCSNWEYDRPLDQVLLKTSGN
ncbi:hypothetical protein OUZ56_016206 [Daphnia magna]|uniref:Uncharacterized protein n=1 Tax=Daphnia magna TaxID=35525 RepID=A0ABR0APZ6_9CRUS|nr:hypothetical protein OUZ56_016206 [Daphnia magna]